MDNITILFLANPTDRELLELDKLPDSTSIVVGNSLEAFKHAAPEARVICHWGVSPKLLEKVLGRFQTTADLS